MKYDAKAHTLSLDTVAEFEGLIARLNTRTADYLFNRFVSDIAGRPMKIGKNYREAIADAVKAVEQLRTPRE